MNDSIYDFSELRKKSSTQIQLSQDGSNQDEALLKSFQELRQKLKLSQRQVASLKDNLKVSILKNKQSQEALNATLCSNIQLKEKVATLTCQNQQIKKNLALMRQTIQKQVNYQQEIQFTKQALMEMKTQIDTLTQQREKIMEVTLAEKLGFQEQINRLKSKIQSDNRYIQELQATCSKNKEIILKQENQIKKISISFEEETFTKNWSKENFQTQHLLNTIKELEKDLTIQKVKNKKEKQKRVILEDKIIELEELSGFHNVKAETFEGQIDMITKKYSKLDKKYKEAKEKLQKAIAQKLQFQQNLTKSIFQSEEFTNKLRNLNLQQVNSLIQQYQLKISTLSCKTQEIHQALTSIQSSTNKILDRPKNETIKNNYYSFDPNSSKNQEQSRMPLGESKGNTPKKEKCSSKDVMYGSNMTFGGHEDENSLIENRIRKEREQMQRRIKEKILCRKMQSSVPGEQFRLRGEYIRTYIDRKY